QYLTSKLSCVLVQSETTTPLLKVEGEVKEEDQLQELEVKEDDLDVIFDKMETIGEKPRKKHIEASETEALDRSEAKKMKPSTEGSTADDSIEEVPDDAIAKLLRSTEKQKRRMEKRKREKKA
ncbi:jg17576, partial [Pararge aegeria aegeria]